MSSDRGGAPRGCAGSMTLQILRCDRTRSGYGRPPPDPGLRRRSTLALSDPVSITRKIEATPFAHARNNTIEMIYRSEKRLPIYDYNYHSFDTASFLLSASRPTQRGVSRSSRTRDGMRWTRQRFARDGIAGRVGERPVSDHQASGREMLQRTAKSCGPDAPTLASSSRS
jgi:hypothetical protein